MSTAEEAVRWLADECVDASLVAHLRANGHDVVYVAELAPGLTDLQAIERADHERRILLTKDKDFGELVVRRRLPVPGLVLLRIDPGLRAIKRSRLERAIQKFGEGLFGRYLIIDEIRLRVRSLGSRD